jgi:hypothetical protein
MNKGDSGAPNQPPVQHNSSWRASETPCPPRSNDTCWGHLATTNQGLPRGLHAHQLPVLLPPNETSTDASLLYLLTSRAPLLFLPHPSLPLTTTKIWKLRQASTDPFAGSIHHKTPPRPLQMLPHWLIACSLALLTYQFFLLHREACCCVCAYVRDFQGRCAASVRSVGFFLVQYVYALRQVCVCGVAVLWWLLWWIGLSIGLEFMVPLCFCMWMHVCVCAQLRRCALVERVIFECLWGCGIFEFDKMPGIALGDLVPDVEADSTMGHIKVRDYCKDGWTIIFSHPG